MMEHFYENSQQLSAVNFFAKSSIVDVWQDCKTVSGFNFTRHEYVRSRQKFLSCVSRASGLKKFNSFSKLLLEAVLFQNYLAVKNMIVGAL